MKISGAVFATAFVAALAAGCFSTNPIAPETRGLGSPVATTQVDGALSVSAGDIAVDPGSGNIVTMGYDNNTYANSILVIARGTGNLVSSTPTNTWGSSLGMVAPNVAMVSDGSYTNTRIDLASGVESAVAGMDALGERSAAYMDGGGDLDSGGGNGGGTVAGGEGEVVSIECEPSPGSSPINVFAGSGTSRALVSSTTLRADIYSVTAVAYAPELDTVWAFTNKGLVGISTVTGDEMVTVEGTEGLYPSGMAWDSTTGRLLIASDDWNTGGFRIDEYEL